jgi:hypothetical protein
MKKNYFLLLGLCLFTSVNAQIINFPDANFKARLLAANADNGFAWNLAGNSFKIDANNNAEIEVSEALQVKMLNANYSNSTSLIGISNFTNLERLHCTNNLLTSLNLNGFSNLTHLYCDFNQLTTLNLTGLPNLWFLKCSNNQLTTLNVNGLINLIYLSCEENQLTSLDLSGSTNLNNLNCSYNPLISLFIKNGIVEANLYYYQNINLQYICADDDQLISIQNNLNNNFSSYNIVLNSYCSFTPGGTFYTIQGNAKYDSDNNGCSTLDLDASNFKFNITNGTTTGNLFSNTAGNYSIPVQTGTHVLTPVLENPTYFTVSPTTLSVTFPTQTSPVTQDFCVTANGIHPDLEVTLLPIEVARPGFDAHYKIIYKNKGNQTQSGSINLTFNDAVLDLVTANPAASSQTTNNLSWAFTGLLPFETREITFTLNVNSPLESPAVNAGTVLNYTTAITSTGTDDTPLDNTFALNQTVVNSFDPNDKTCLEGATITPSMVGQYVHYMIRFENTGTYPAENIVVKDMIDATKFDVSTLVPTSGSHPFVTRITAGNKVEFIFENINLPFDDANNDGYVAFKIKTKPTLVVGNTFSNTASIYFDYNAPIVTDPAITTIVVLGTQDFEFSTYFSLYPNPTADILNIDLKKEIEVSSINIYNTLGQLVLVIPNAQELKTVDVSGLTTGNYFVKLNTDKGMGTSKFIKK